MPIDKVLVWGIGMNYQKICNALKWNEEIGSFEVLAFISRDYGQKDFDGKKVIKPEQILDMYGGDFNYIIVSTEQYYQEIVAYGTKDLKIDRDKFMHGKIFEIPCFDWKRYIKVYKSDISIIAEFCYGGFLSHHLGLPFCSPFVNVRVGTKLGYQKMIKQINNYMSLTPQLMKTGQKEFEKYAECVGGGCVEYPLLCYDDILLHGFHYKSEEDFLSKWEQRRKRYNPKSNVVFKILYDESDIEDFDKLEIDNKIGFYYENTDKENIITIPFNKQHYTYSFAVCVNEYIRSQNIFSQIDIFKLLLGEKGFKR